MNIQNYAEVNRMLRLRNPFPLELCKKKKKRHTYRGKKVKHSELAWCQCYKKAKKRTRKVPLSLWEQIFAFREEKLPFACQKNSRYAQWRKAATQGSNSKNCALQIVFESWMMCTMLMLGCSSPGEAPDAAPGQEDGAAGWVREGRGLLQLLGACLRRKRYCSCHAQLQCGRLGKPQSGARRTLVIQMRGADRVVSPSALQVSICFGHFNCKVLRWWAVSPSGPGTIRACFW